MPSPVRPSSWSLVMPFVCALAGCETQPTHEVLTLTELTPRQVEPGDRLVLHTNGLPPVADIRRVTVRLAARLARPGMARCESTVTAVITDPPEGTTVTDALSGQPREATYGEVAAHALRIEGATRLEFTLTDSLVRSLSRCAGESASEPLASHATLSFLGDRGGVSVQVETLQGTVLSSARALRGPIVDLHLSQGRGLDVTRAALSRAERALSGVGVRLAPVLPPEGGLQVERVDPGSAADEAGVADGDVLVRLDGVSLTAIDDFRPSPGRDMAVLTVRRGDAVEDRPLRVSHLDPKVSWDMVLAAVMVLLAGALLWSSRQRVPRVLRRAARAIGMWREDLPEPVVAAPWSAAQHRLGWMALGTTALAVPFGSGIFLVDPDVLAATLALVVGGAALATTRHSGVRAKVGVAAREMMRGLPLVVGAGAAVAAAGSLGFQGVAASQGALPWQWNLFRDPLLLGVGAYAVAWVLAGFESGPRPSLPLHLAERLLTWSRSVLLALLLLGAWRLPAVGAGVQASSVGLQMLGVGVLLAKAWALHAAARRVRRLTRRPRAEFLTRVAWIAALPAATLALAAYTALALAGSRLPWAARDAAGSLVAWATFGWCALSAGAWAFARWGARRPAVDYHAA